MNRSPVHVHLVAPSLMSWGLQRLVQTAGSPFVLTGASTTLEEAKGVLERQMFLGEFLECGVRVGETVLVTRQHPSLRLRPGDQLYLELPIELCAVISDTHGVAASAYLGEEHDSAAPLRASSA